MPDGHDAVMPPPRAADEILDWLVRYLATLLECEETDIGVDVPFNRFGMDSSSAVGMTGDLAEWLGFELDPTLPYDYPTIETLARHLAEASAARAAVRSAV
jgi:acyl carrier protein